MKKVKAMIYLDNAATTFPKPESVYARMDEVNRNLAVNAGRGSYRVAQDATKIIDETRKLILQLVKARGNEKAVITDSATTALNIILRGIDFNEGDVVYISPYEHNAVVRVLEQIKNNKKIIVEELPIDERTLGIDLDKTQYLFTKDVPRCVVCTHVSNVTGYILPVKAIFDLAKKKNAITVLDASQSLGLLEVDVNNISADFIAYAGHKTLYGPFGASGFIDVNNYPLNLVFAGGTGSNSLNLDMPKESPECYEAGSKNIVAIAGLNQALKDINQEENYKIEKELSGYLIQEFKNCSNVILYIPDSYEQEHIGVVSFNIDGYMADDIGGILSDEFEICVRTGYHCAPLIHKYLDNKSFMGTVRVGLSKFSNMMEIDELIKAIKDIN